VRVGIDARHLTGSRGVAHYTGALLAALASSFPDDQWVFLVPGRAPLEDRFGVLAHSNVVLRRHPLPGRVLFGTGRVAGAPRLEALLGDGLDVVWLPAPAPVALSGEVPFVLTLHDLSFEQRPRDFTPYERLWHRLARPERLAARAQRIMVVSKATRDAVARRWAITEPKVTVVAPGVTPASPAPTPDAIAEVRTRHRLPARYLLVVGALEPRKAPELVARAHARARREGLDAALVFAGGGRLARRLRGSEGRVLGFVPVSELDALYAGALALVMPSWLEGFGLPPLEAAARGTPAVVSDLAVYDETLGANALRFPPGDEVALAAALMRIVSDGELRGRLVSGARQSIARLSWERAAHAARGVLAEAARA